MAQAPASICSTRPCGKLALPLAKRPIFIGKASIACSMRAMCQGPGVAVVAAVPPAGAGPPPHLVGAPGEEPPPDYPRRDHRTWTINPPAGEDLPFPAG